LELSETPFSAETQDLGTRSEIILSKLPQPRYAIRGPPAAHSVRPKVSSGRLMKITESRRTRSHGCRSRAPEGLLAISPPQARRRRGASQRGSPIDDSDGTKSKVRARAALSPSERQAGSSRV